MRSLSKWPYFWFSLLSILVALPLSPLLSKAGMSICPILREHGFWLGCALNLRFVIYLLTVNLLFGNLAIWAMEKRPPRLKSVDSSVLLGAIVLGSSLVATFTLRRIFWDSLMTAGSPLGRSISMVLVVAGSAISLFEVTLLDLILLEKDAGNKDISAGERPWGRDLVAEIWSGVLFVVAPFFVLSLLGYFQLLAYETQTEGWSTVAEMRPKIMASTAIVFAWYATNLVFLYLARMQIVGRLREQAERLRNLESSGRVGLNRMGALGTVGAGLNQSAEVLAQKARLLSGFSRFVSDRLLEKVVHSDTLELKGQHVDCAIMMADVRNFTTMSAEMKPDDVVRLLNIYFEETISILYRYGVHIDKFIGDGLLAYIPLAGVVDATQACRAMVNASAEMLRQIHHTNERLAAEGLPRIKAGIGLHFGQVVLGAIGSESRMQYTIIGDSVNRAARIESLCKEIASELVVSEDLFERLESDTQAMFKGPKSVTLKGISKEVSVYYLPAASAKDDTAAA